MYERITLAGTVEGNSLASPNEASAERGMFEIICFVEKLKTFSKISVKLPQFP